MNYWDHVVIVFRYPLWIVICALPLFLFSLADKPGKFEPELYAIAIILQASLMLCFYFGVIK